MDMKLELPKVDLGATVILGNGSFAQRVAQEARKTSENVKLGISSSVLKGKPTNATALDFDSPEGWLDFNKFMTAASPINTVILAFTPRSSKEGIKESSCVTVDQVMIPLMKCVKAALYRFRRDTRGLLGRKIVFVVAKGDDEDHMVTANAVLGFYRSLTHRIEAIGANTEILYVDLEKKSDTEVAIDKLLTYAYKQPVIHLVENGKITIKAASTGTCDSKSNQSFGFRVVLLITLAEKFLHLKHTIFNMFSFILNPKHRSLLFYLKQTIILTLQIVLQQAMFIITTWAFDNSHHTLAFIFALASTRFNLVTIMAIVIHVASQTIGSNSMLTHSGHIPVLLMTVITFGVIANGQKVARV